jgi:hypothetical protein
LHDRDIAICYRKQNLLDHSFHVFETASNKTHARRTTLLEPKRMRGEQLGGMILLARQRLIWKSAGEQSKKKNNLRQTKKTKSKT